MKYSRENLKAEWGKSTRDLLLGKKIANVRYMTDDEMENFAWMEINITPQDIVKMSKDKVDECNDIFKKPLNITEASNLLNAVLPQLEQKISDMMEEEIYDDLMDKNGGHDWIDEKVTKYLQDGDNK